MTLNLPLPVYEAGAFTLGWIAIQLLGRHADVITPCLALVAAMLVAIVLAIVAVQYAPASAAAGLVDMGSQWPYASAV